MNGQVFKRQSVALLILLSLTLSIGVSTAAVAQPDQRLSLFDSVAVTPAVNNAQAAAVNVTAGPGVISFVLVGTSQLGDKHRARLRNPAGEIVTVELNPQGSTPVPGYPGFEVSRVNGRELVVQHPVSSPCMGSQEQGVRCTDSHQSRLELATAAAVIRQETPARSDETAHSEQDDTNGAENNVPENPFAAALRAARERGERVDPAVMRAEGARFRPRRIDPADVPPGSQLIRTPFGDRIVTQ